MYETKIIREDDVSVIEKYNRARGASIECLDLEGLIQHCVFAVSQSNPSRARCRLASRCAAIDTSSNDTPSMTPMILPLSFEQGH